MFWPNLIPVFYRFNSKLCQKAWLKRQYIFKKKKVRIFNAYFGLCGWLDLNNFGSAGQQTHHANLGYIWFQYIFTLDNLARNTFTLKNNEILVFQSSLLWGYLGISRVMKISLPKLMMFGSSTEKSFKGVALLLYSLPTWSFLTFFFNTEPRDRQSKILFFLLKYFID